MGSLLDNPWALAGLGFLLEFLLLSMTYKAGYSAARIQAALALERANEMIINLQRKNDFLRADVDNLRTRIRNLKEAHDQRMRADFPPGIISRQRDWTEKDTGALRGLLDSAKISSKPMPEHTSVVQPAQMHERCGEIGCPVCRPIPPPSPEKPQ